MSNLPERPQLPSSLSVALAVGAAIVMWIVVSSVLGFLFTIAKLALVLGAVVGVFWLMSKSSD